MIKLMVLGNANRPGVLEEADQLIPLLKKCADVELIDLHQREDLLAYSADLVVVMGGDGAILRAARQMAYRQRPVLGINLGRLGFLADLTVEEFRDHLSQILSGEYTVTEHLMFEARMETTVGDHSGKSFLGLNDIIVHTGPPFHMLDLELQIDGEPAAQYSGDGLIVSTPVGSTAHSLSAGGPILGQELPAFVITPICPHGLTSRPLVDSADKTYTIEVSRGSNAVLVVDGQESFTMEKGAKVHVRKAPVKFQLARVAGRSYYRTLHDKLHWGTQPTYRNEPPRPV